MPTYYTYTSHAGYGRDDHMADEIIARAAALLGAPGAAAYVAAAVGLASHAVPMAGAIVRMPVETGMRRRMESALRAARREVTCSDTLISVDLVRESWESRGLERRRVIEVKEGRRWIVKDTGEWIDDPGALRDYARRRDDRERERARTGIWPE